MDHSLEGPTYKQALQKEAKGEVCANSHGNLWRTRDGYGVSKPHSHRCASPFRKILLLISVSNVEWRTSLCVIVYSHPRCCCYWRGRVYSIRDQMLRTCLQRSVSAFLMSRAWRCGNHGSPIPQWLAQSYFQSVNMMTHPRHLSPSSTFALLSFSQGSLWTPVSPVLGLRLLPPPLSSQEVGAAVRRARLLFLRILRPALLAEDHRSLHRFPRVFQREGAQHGRCDSGG